MNYLGNIPAGIVLYIPFNTFNAAGASVTMTGLALADIKIYKNGSITERASTAGFALLDTDGIDFDGITGIHGFSINLADDTTAGFFSVGGFYWVVIDTVTVDAQVIKFIAASFRIVAAEATAGYPTVNAGLVANAAPETAASVATATRAEMDSNSTDLNALVTQTSTIAGYLDTEITAIKAKTDLLPAVAPGAGGGLAIVGSAMTLSTAERDAVADAHLDRLNGIEAGRSPRQALRAAAAAAGGVVTGAGTASIGIAALGNPGTPRIATSGSDADGNRPTVTLTLT